VIVVSGPDSLVSTMVGLGDGGGVKLKCKLALQPTITQAKIPIRKN